MPLGVIYLGLLLAGVACFLLHYVALLQVARRLREAHPDQWKIIGSARFVITQPRVPCFKLGLRFGDPSMPQRFARSLRSGVYLRVLEQGEISAGDTVDVVAPAKRRINIRSLFAAYLTPNERDSQDMLAAALAVPGLSAEWHAQISERLARRGHPSAD